MLSLHKAKMYCHHSYVNELVSDLTITAQARNQQSIFCVKAVLKWPAFKLFTQMGSITEFSFEILRTN